jgi:hypothetical protein
LDIKSVKLENDNKEVTNIAKPAPTSWKKEVVEKWATLPPEVQSEVERR